MILFAEENEKHYSMANMLAYETQKQTHNNKIITLQLRFFPMAFEITSRNHNCHI